MPEQPTEPVGNSIYDDFYVEDEWMEKGEWMSRPGASYSFLVVYCGPLNRDVQRAIAEQYLKNRDTMSKNDDGDIEMNDDDANTLTKDFLCEHAVKGWRGITTRDGKVRKFSKGALRDLLNDMPALVDWLWSRCQSKSYYPEAVRDAVKN